MKISLLLILALVGIASAQAPDTLWTKWFPGGINDAANDICVLPDSTLALAGRLTYVNTMSDASVLRISSSGTLLGGGTFGYSDNQELMSIALSPSGGLICAGQSHVSALDWQFCATRLTPTAAPMWLRSYGSQGIEKAVAALVESDSLYTIIGYSNSLPGPDYNIWILFIDEQGDSLYSYSFGDNSNEIPSGACKIGPVIYICGTKEDRGFVLAITESGDSLWTAMSEYTGSSYSAIVPSNDSSVMVVGSRLVGGNSDFYVVRINTFDPTVVWQRTMGSPTVSEYGKGIARLDESSFVCVGGTSGTSNPVAMSVSINGDSLWTRTLVTPIFDTFTSVVSWNCRVFAAGWSTPSSVNKFYCAALDTACAPKGLWLSQDNAPTTVTLFSTDSIRWTSRGIDGEVSIVLNRDYPTGPWEIIVDSTENDGEYDWFVTDPLSDYCRIQICAIQDTFCDVSSENFSIVSSQGYLALVSPDTPNAPILSTSFETLECSDSVALTFFLRNFGDESTIVFQPQGPLNNEFSMTTSCASFFALTPGSISACSLMISFAPTEVGSFFDTLRIQTDAVNGVNGYVDITLSGSQIRTPKAPEVVLSTAGNNCVLRWDPVTQSIGNCDINSPAYLVFFSDDPDGQFSFHGGTLDTTYTHVLAVQFAPEMFYHVYAVVNEPGMLASLPSGANGMGLSESKTLAVVRDFRNRYDESK